MSFDLYQELILEHASHPLHKGALTTPSKVVPAKNSSCGDTFVLQLHFKDNVITEVGWTGAGCAVSTASMSVVSDMLVGKTITEAKKIDKQAIVDALGLQDIMLSRERCAFLPLRALQEL